MEMLIFATANSFLISRSVLFSGWLRLPGLMKPLTVSATNAVQETGILPSSGLESSFFSLLCFGGRRTPRLISSSLALASSSARLIGLRSRTTAKNTRITMMMIWMIGLTLLPLHQNFTLRIFRMIKKPISSQRAQKISIYCPIASSKKIEM